MKLQCLTSDALETDVLVRSCDLFNVRSFPTVWSELFLMVDNKSVSMLNVNAAAVCE